MGQVIRGGAYRARTNGRQGRLGWLLLITIFNLALWGGVIALIVRAT